MRKVFGILIAGIVALGVMSAPGQNVYAAEGAITQTVTNRDEVDRKCSTFLFGLRPWYHKLTYTTSNNRCEVGTPDKDKMAAFVWTIILNVAFDLFLVSGYLATVFIMYGGYLYIFSTGDAGKAAKGKRTITTAVIGLVIVVLSSVISNLIVEVITK